jgi:adenylate cyclase
MTATTVTRRLAAIIAADVVGYSRLMGADEEGTHKRVKAHLVELLDPKIREHHGRIVKTTGDGVLAEFASVVDAVRCAGEIQRAMVDRDLDLAEERRLRFRIGVNLGDVIADGGDIYGDGVNIAVRLEGLAAPGSICVSGTVRDHIGDRLPYTFTDMGEQSVKNIARPVRVYAVRPEDITGVPAASVSSATSSPPPLAAPRLSIVVLPFTNLSNDPEQQYFVDGITDDLTTDLSRLVNMFVIPRNTALTYRNKPVDTKQIGRELRVRYVLEGSVRRSGNRVRVNAQLVDADADAHLWAERFDRDTIDLFAMQDEITSRIALALNSTLVTAEAARPTENPDALDYIFRARAAGWKPPSRDKYAEEIRLFECALAIDPCSPEARSSLANALMSRVISGMADSATADINRAEGLVGQVLSASPRNPLAHFAKGQVLRAQRRFEEAIPEYETAIESNRNWVGALHPLGQCKLFIGSIEETIPLEERAIGLSPRDPGLLGVWYSQIGLVHLLQSRTDEAIFWQEKARVAMPERPDVHANLSSAYALRGETERAAAELAEARRLSNDGRYTSIAQMKAVGYFGVPKIRALFEATFFAGLRKAGMPEE